jgi:hypothetical protein
MANTVSKLNPEWITETRQYFLDFLELTNFPHPARDGTRGSSFDYPEWLIMFIAVMSVKCREKTYLGIHRMVEKYSLVLGKELDLPVISESQLRARLKKNLPYAWKTSRFHISNISSRIPQLARQVPIR